MRKKFLSLFLVCLLVFTLAESKAPSPPIKASATDSSLIKWVEFNITYQALKDTMDEDIETFEQDVHMNWIESLAWLSCKYGGNFSAYKRADLKTLSEMRLSGKSMEEITKDMKYYDYYYRCCYAVLNGFLSMDKKGNYGLAAYSPIAKGYWYNDSDDFGNGRSYGFARRHLGHDMFCSTGTPVAAVEGGKVEALGWNQYGGWRIGIRSHDGSRYYYYAHLRKDTPYIKGLKIGDTVDAGQIIGYTGQTGYSRKENVNNINVPHLHFGMQLIFDESQKECNAEIWIDVYALIRLLSEHRAEALIEKDKPAFSSSNPPATPNTAKIPILMYHGLTDQQKRVNNYVILAKTFEDDLKYLASHGYTAVTMTELIDFVYDKTGTATLPDKPVVLSFDDGYYNNDTFGTPLLEKYHMKAVISLIGDACQEATDAKYLAKASCNVTWDQVTEMSESGLWEIQNHTYNLHKIRSGRKGASRSAGESVAAYEKRLTEDLTLLQEEIAASTGSRPNTLVWPFGAYTEDSRALLKSLGFKATMGCREGINTLTRGDTEGLFLLKRYLRTPGADIKKILQ